jgi:hypothetical protein
MDFEEINPLWALSDPVTVQQAAALIAGFEPNAVRFNSNDVAWFESETGLTDSGGITWVKTAFAALTNAILAGKLKATIRYSAREYGYADQIADIEINEACFEVGYGRNAEKGEQLADDHSCFYKPFPDWSLTMVERGELIYWLRNRGIRSGFFFPNSTDTPDFLDSKNSRYAPKLAAAVRAWQSVTDAGGKHPKQALAKWLREHAAEFGMTDDEGKPNETGIEEAAKVANWQPGGGAPKTPGE